VLTNRWVAIQGEYFRIVAELRHRPLGMKPEEVDLSMCHLTFEIPVGYDALGNKTWKEPVAFKGRKSVWLGPPQLLERLEIGHCGKHWDEASKLKKALEELMLIMCDAKERPEINLPKEKEKVDA